MRAGARTFRNSLEGLNDTLYTTTIVVQGLMLTTAAMEFYRARGYKEQAGVLMNQAAALPSSNNNNNLINTGIATRTRSRRQANRRERLTLSSPVANYSNAGGNRNNSNIPVAGPANMRSPRNNNNSNNNR